MSNLHPHTDTTWLDKIINEQRTIHERMGITPEMLDVAANYSEADEVADAKRTNQTKDCYALRNTNQNSL